MEEISAFLEALASAIFISFFIPLKSFKTHFWGDPVFFSISLYTRVSITQTLGEIRFESIRINVLALFDPCFRRDLAPDLDFCIMFPFPKSLRL